MRRNSRLDGVRGLALLFVLLSHASNRGLHFFGLDFSGSGRYGVFIFFVLSAFLLTYIFLLEGGVTRENIKTYFKRRVYRIYPLFVIFLAVYAVLNKIGVNLIPIDFSDLLKSLLLVQAKPLFWTIVVEFQFYMVLPFLMLGLGKISNLQAIFVVLILAWLFLALNVDPAYTGTLLPFVNIFIAGSAAAFLYHGIDAGKVRAPSSNLMVLMSFVAVAAFVLMVPSFYMWTLNMKVNNDHFHLEFWLFGVLASVLVLTAALSKRHFLFDSRVLVFIGRVSFSGYLFHLIPLYFVLSIFGAGTFSHVMYMLLTLCGSYVLFKYIERPLYRKAHPSKALTAVADGK